MVAAFISNCNNKERLEIMKELMKNGVTIDSYGRCLNNKKEKKSKNFDIEKINKISKYKFTIAFENVRKGFITEKVFQALVAGSIPLFYGDDEDMKVFQPGEKSVINVNDFKTVKELADFIIYLSNNEIEYSKYFEWKKNPSDVRFEIVIF
jgi:hypothetical protein